MCVLMQMMCMRMYRMRRGRAVRQRRRLVRVGRLLLRGGHIGREEAGARRGEARTGRRVLLRVLRRDGRRETRRGLPTDADTGAAARTRDRLALRRRRERLERAHALPERHRRYARHCDQQRRPSRGYSQRIVNCD